MTMYYEVEKQEYNISTDPALLDIEIIHNYLSGQSYWAAGIPKETVIRSIKGSLCFGLFCNGRQIGFARVITDKATFAYLADVFVLTEYRGKGLSKWLMEVIHAHPELQGLRRWMLATRDAYGLYEQFGWTLPDDDGSKRIMEKIKKDAYQ